MAHLLAMTKPLSGICPIAMGEILYQFTKFQLIKLEILLIQVFCYFPSSFIIFAPSIP
jgi:hypothetical protein